LKLEVSFFYYLFDKYKGFVTTMINIHNNIFASTEMGEIYIIDNRSF